MTIKTTLNKWQLCAKVLKLTAPLRLDLRYRCFVLFPPYIKIWGHEGRVDINMTIDKSVEVHIIFAKNSNFMRLLIRFLPIRALNPNIPL